MRPPNASSAGLPTPDSPTQVSLLEGIFTGLRVETPPQTLSQAKSLEDLRIPKEEEEHQYTFDYQVRDVGEQSRLPRALTANVGSRGHFRASGGKEGDGTCSEARD